MGFEQALELRVTQNLITRLKRSALRLILEGSHYCKIDFLAQFFAVNIKVAVIICDSTVVM